MIGQLLDGRYQVATALGSGGFGQTYVALDTRRPGHPQCVVKHLKPLVSNDPKLLETAKRLFNSEAETLEKLGCHDQIPRLLAHFEQDGEFYLVEEFIEGHDLTKELPQGKQQDESYAVALLEAVLPVLEFVHRQGVIHRDIKPPNIIRRQSDGLPVLIDFGAVKQVHAPTVLSHGMSATISIGSDGYTPTEQGRGKPRPSSDLYALGMVCIQALTGIAPRDLPEDADTGEIQWQELTSVSPALAEILSKMIRYHFKDRYQLATEALEALQRLKAGGYSPTEVGKPNHGYSATTFEPKKNGSEIKPIPLEPLPPPLSPLSPSLPLSKPVTPKRWLWLVGAGVTAVVISGLAVYGSNWQTQQKEAAVLASIKEQKGAGKYDDCIKTAETVPKRAGIYSNVQLLLNECTTSQGKDQLTKAQNLAKGNKLEDAIAEAIKVSANSPLYQDAQKLITQWTDSFLQTLEKQYKNEGNLDEIIKFSQVISPSTSSNKKVQVLISQWQNESKNNEDFLKKAQQAAGSGNWKDVISNADKITLLGEKVDRSSSYWKQRAAPLVDKAETEIAVKEQQNQGLSLQSNKDSSQSTPVTSTVGTLQPHPSQNPSPELQKRDEPLIPGL